MERRNVVDVDDARGCCEMALHQVDEVGAAGQYRRVAAVIVQKLQSFGFGCGRRVLEFFHAWLPFSASRTRFGVSGITGTRTPMALATAFEIVAPHAITGGSPRPITPRWYSLSG